jgi:Uri superfamily endonuclease
MGGYKSRLTRYLKENTKQHWHIDYLLMKASIKNLILCEAEERIECTIAQALNHRFKSIPGFGSSDCKCKSHLFMADHEMKSPIIIILSSFGIKLKLLKYNRIKNIFLPSKTDANIEDLSFGPH